MLELNRAQGTTLILVTHDEALASRCGWRRGGWSIVIPAQAGIQ